MADLGCGSGLSAAALSGHEWVGIDVSAVMLRLAAAAGAACSGRLVMSDFGQGMPLRAAVLDGAISVSAVQWLCCGADPPTQVRRFFASLARCLRPGAVAALQVYVEGAPPPARREDRLRRLCH